MENSSLLIVDDDAALRLVLSDGLRRLGAQVTDVASVVEADAALAREKFDLIISDVHLHGNEGLKWTERLLRSAHTPPVLLITGNPEVVTAMRAANLPVAGYLAKPMAFADIVAVVTRVLAVQRQRQALHALAGEVRELAAATEGLPPATVVRLEALSVSLAAEAARPAREADHSHAPWRAAITETITVLEKTRDSFRSKELARLRRHLQQVLGNGAMWVILAGGLVRLASHLLR